MGALRPEDLYRGIDWPVIVLLGAFIPIGEALHTIGVTQIIAVTLVSISASWSAVAALTLILVTTMLLTEVLNNATTALLVAPIAASTAAALGPNLDPFLIVAALGVSCAFMTPVGHQSNTLVMGPGDYRSGDYWRVGLPLQIVVVVVAIPLVTRFWPLGIQDLACMPVYKVRSKHRSHKSGEH